MRDPKENDHTESEYSIAIHSDFAASEETAETSKGPGVSHLRSPLCSLSSPYPSITNSTDVFKTEFVIKDGMSKLSWV